MRRPHFHAIYGEHEAEIEIASGTIMEGKLPRGLVEKWAETHRQQLHQNWDLARAGEQLEQVEPLQ